MVALMLVRFSAGITSPVLAIVYLGLERGSICFPASGSKMTWVCSSAGSKRSGTSVPESKNLWDRFRLEEDLGWKALDPPLLELCEQRQLDTGAPALAAGCQARSTDSIDTAGEGHVRSLGNANSNIKGKPAKRLSITRGHFPKLTECAHFHYEAVDFGHIQLQLGPEQNENLGNLEEGELLFAVQVTCQGKSWQVHRSYEEFRTLDAHLHCCIFDRRFSQLPELPPFSHMRANPELLVPMLSQYLEKLSAIVDSNINCGPVLTWMEIDNHGNRLLVNEEASINVPAIAAAHVVKRYIAQASDELSFEVGDIISVIDMPPKEDRSWWRGKHGFQVGFFPSECVELFSERPSPGLKTDGEGLSCGIARPHGLLSPTSVSKKHGKLIGFLRTFMKSRPSKQRLKQRGILRERVFGCDLGEHLKNSGSDGELRDLSWEGRVAPSSATEY
ncbi:Rho GTPase-activating protein 33 [Varanus komodoensis]|nr:Rho GTPase-activating protein 33 [Varanus komodoensis]